MSMHKNDRPVVDGHGRKYDVGPLAVFGWFWLLVESWEDGRRQTDGQDC